MLSRSESHVFCWEILLCGVGFEGTWESRNKWSWSSHERWCFRILNFSLCTVCLWAYHNCLYKLLSWKIEFLYAKRNCSSLISSNGLLKDRPVIVWFHCAGDNNMGDDRVLYAHGQMWLQRHHIMGRAVGYISQLLPQLCNTFLCLWVLTLWIFHDICRFLPYVGWVTIIMTEKPYIKVNF
jgi:hypothetical protein